MHGFFRDLRFAGRTLRQNPLFTAIAVGTLALGIGANTAIFTVLDAVALRPLAYRDADRLVEVVQRDTRSGKTDDQLSFPNFRDLRAGSRTLTELSPLRFWLFSMGGSEHPEAVLGAYAGDSIFAILGVHPALGAGFTPGAEHTGAPREVILSHGLWQRQYGGAADIIGRAIPVDGVPTTVVGVLPKGFRFPQVIPANTPLPSREPDIYLPIGLEGAAMHEARGSVNYWAVARLAPGVSLAGARQEVEAIGARLSAQYPDQFAHSTLSIRPLKSEVVGESGRPLLILFGAVAFVLLIACANVGGLLLARAAARQREMAIRSALGASGRRLVGQLLSESLLLGLLGGGAGLLVAAWGVSLLRALAPPALPRIEEIAIDGRVLLFAVVASLLSALLFGLVPAIRPRTEGLVTSLREAGRTSGSGSRRRARAGLVIAEVTLSVVLLTGAGMLLRSFSRLSAVDVGFDRDHVITMLTLLPPVRYGGDDTRRQYENEVLRRVRALPGVVSVGTVNTLPLSNLGNNTSMDFVDHPAATPGEEPVIAFRTIGGDYFKTLGMRLVAGRFFTDQDVKGAAPVVIINEATARRYYPGMNPLGRAIRDIEGDTTHRTIVGVVGDVRGEALDVDPEPEVSAPFDQSPDMIITLAVRTTGDPTALLPALRKTLAGIDPAQGWYAERTLESLVAASLARQRFDLLLLGAFAALALILAVVGLYGILAYSVTQRSREIGIRMALGAGRGAVLRQVMREGILLTGVGLGLGGLGAIAVGRAIRSELYRAGRFDPVAFGGVVVLFALAAGVATFLPARRATRVDPVRAMRSD